MDMFYATTEQLNLYYQNDILYLYKYNKQLDLNQFLKMTIVNLDLLYFYVYM